VAVLAQFGRRVTEDGGRERAAGDGNVVLMGRGEVVPP
jgi:hypothetical protein